jgi:hypothetical protein
MNRSVATRVTSRRTNVVLRTALERDIMHRVVELRETLRQTGDAYDAFTYADGIIIVSATDTNNDLARKVLDMLVG